ARHRWSQAVLQKLHPWPETGPSRLLPSLPQPKHFRYQRSTLPGPLCRLANEAMKPRGKVCGHDSTLFLFHEAEWRVPLLEGGECGSQGTSVADSGLAARTD